MGIPIFFIPRGFVSVSFLKNPTPGGLPPRDHAVVLPGEEDGTQWTYQGPEYFCMDIPFPTEYGFCRTTGDTKLFEDRGTNLPLDDKNGKNYAIVVRLTYDVSSSDVQVRFPFPYGAEFDILAGQQFPAINYHFYAEPIFDDNHNPSMAFEMMKPMFSPIPDLYMKDDIQSVAEPPKACDGLSVEDVEDIGEYLGVPAPARTPQDAKLRNCLALFIQASTT